jgi:hypothetical protein
MPEIEFLIDTETGKCQTEIKGIAGAACERTARALKKLLGSPSVDKKTKDYYVRPKIKRQVRGK